MCDYDEALVRLIFLVVDQYGVQIVLKPVFPYLHGAFPFDTSRDSTIFEIIQQAKNHKEYEDG